MQYIRIPKHTSSFSKYLKIPSIIINKLGNVTNKEYISLTLIKLPSLDEGKGQRAKFLSLA